MHKLYLLFRALLISAAFVVLGTIVLVIPLDASPIWPLDGILAILGGIGLGWLSIAVRGEMGEDATQEGDGNSEEESQEATHG